MRIVFIAICIAFMPGILAAQEYYVRGYTGLTYYQGDLAPLSIRYSFSKGQPAYGLYTGAKISNFYNVGIKFLRGKLSATDREARNEWRRLRNLSFESNIYEFGIVTELNLNVLFKGLDRYGIQLYYTTGVNLFAFNPKAEYMGELVALKPLSTEGQGLQQFPDQDNYALTQVNIPFGLGVKFNIAYNLQIGFEFVPRWTFTDYLDDVSSIYINYQELKDLKGEVAAALSNRTGELLGTGPVNVPTGTFRGDPNDNDWYLYTGFFFGYVIGAAKPQK